MIFVFFLSVATLHTAVSVCFSAVCPMAMEKGGCCHEGLSKAPAVKGACCEISDASASDPFLKPEGVAPFALLLPAFSETPLLLQATLVAMAPMLPPLPKPPQKTVLRI